jgi:hypothetical protein
MWTKRNHHAPKSECVEFFNSCPTRAVLMMKKKPPFITISLCMGLCLFLPEHLFCFSHRKICWTMSVNNVGLCLLGTLNSMVALTFFSLGVNQSDPRIRSTTNHKFYKTLEQLMVHGVNNLLHTKLLKAVLAGTNGQKEKKK